jgi:hypothetical protein
LPEFTYEREPYAPFADEGQPLFFRRRYGGNPQPQHERDNTIFVDLSPAQAIWIYGYSYQSEYPEDRALDPEVWQRRRAFFAWNHSVMEPRGEPGYVPLDAVEEISREEFEAAAARDWA